MDKFLLVLIPKKPLLSNSQLERLSSICADVGQVAIGSIVIPFLLDKLDPFLVTSGLLIAFIFWLLSLWLSGKIL